MTNFYDFRFKWTATAAIWIHPTKAWLSQLVDFKYAICTWRHFKRTICNKILFSTWKRMECFKLLLDHLAWMQHQFLSGIRKARSLLGIMWEKSEHKSWLAKGLGLEYWGFKGVQEEIPREDSSPLQIRSVALAFPTRQSTSPLFHPCHRLFDMIKTVPHPLLLFPQCFRPSSGDCRTRKPSRNHGGRLFWFRVQVLSIPVYYSTPVLRIEPSDDCLLRSSGNHRL